VVQLSPGIHYLQEDHPEAIDATVKEWLIDSGLVPAQTQGDIIRIFSDALTSACIFPARAVNRHGQVPSVVLHSSWQQIIAPEGGVARVAVVFRKPSNVTNLDR
jgi:hypothetical protein